MKILEFLEPLLEYNRNVTADKFGGKLVAAANRDQRQTLDVILDQLESIDPTKNKQYILWLCNQYINGQFLLQDRDKINQSLVNFGKLKSRLPVKDINKYTISTLADTIDGILNAKLGTDKNGIYPVIPDAKILYNGPLGQLAVPKTKEASCELGRGTKWCTAATISDNKFHEYDEAPLFVWRDKNGEKYQFFFGIPGHKKKPAFNQSNNLPIEPEQLKFFRTRHPILSQLFKQEEPSRLKDAMTAYRYASIVLKNPWPEAEPIIIKDPLVACNYAKHVLKRPWPEAEPTIVKSKEAAYYYARYILRRPWPEAEPYIIKDPHYAYEYAVNVIKDRWPKAESTIAKNPRYAYEYAKNIINGLWPEAEPIIMKDPKNAFNYARYIINGRWPEAEPYIATGKEAAYYYARYILKDRWPKAEPYIIKDPHYAYEYAKHVIKDRWPAAESTIAKDPTIYSEYMAHFGQS